MTIFQFADPANLERIAAAGDDELNALDFGVIGFDRDGIVRRYNVFESRASGMARERVIGAHLFTGVAPCMNNYMIAQRFEDAETAGIALDAEIDYVLTLKMRPTLVKLRMLSRPGQPLSYVLLHRKA